MQVYCSQEHANNSSHRFCTHCGEALFLTVMRFKGICTPGCENRGFAKS
jgi:NADH pyrophosphatase NudC (nudix superfamily)